MASGFQLVFYAMICVHTFQSENVAAKNGNFFKQIQVEYQTLLLGAITTSPTSSHIECGALCRVDQQCDVFSWDQPTLTCTTAKAQNLAGDYSGNGVKAYIDDSLTPVDSMWGQWSNWGSCSLTCGSGIQTRTRICISPLYGGLRICPKDSNNTESSACNTQTCSSCANYINTSQTFNSPNYPSSYANSEYQCFFVEAPVGKRITVTFTFLNTESCCDFVKIYDGPYSTASLIMSASGQAIPSPQVYTTSGNLMLFIFTSDGSIVLTGYSATMTFV